MSDASVDHDVRDFHQYAASAVDLTHVSSVEDAQGTTTVFVTAIRSSRQWDPPLDQQRRQSHLYRFSLNATTTQPLQNLPPIPLDASIQIYLPSPSGKKTVVVTTTTTTTAEKKDKTSTLQVWEGAVLISCIVLKTHGTIIHDPTGFGTPVWSPDETHLLYNAERLPEPAEAFWKMTAADDDDKNDSNKIPAHRRRGGQFVLGIGQREHWGERYSTQEPILDLFLLNLQSGRIAKVDNVPTCYPGRDDTSGDDETITLGQAVWHPSGNKIAFTGWDAGLPKRLGMVYCRNRFSKVFEASVENLLKKLQADDDESKDGSDDEAFRCLTNDLPYARSPRYVSMESGDPALVFLGNHRQFVSHDAAMGLWHVTRKGEIDNIVPIIDMPLKEGPSVLGIGFPGLFLGQLPINCDMGESNNYLIANTLFGSVQRIIRVDVSSGNVDLIHIPELNELSSQAMCALAPSGDMVLSAVSCVSPASLWIVPAAGLQEKSTNGRLILHAQNVASFGPIACSTFAPVSKTTTFPFDMQILSIDPPEIEGTTAEPIQAILLLPKDVPQGEKVPLVVVPHGGPHSCTMSTFVPGFAHLASKYAVLFPNYRGSIGFGQAPMDSLLTRIGHVDVEDVMACTRHVIEKFSTIDGNRVGICGGSHGGFLTAHCTTQYPDFFKAGE
jgi:acylaminoacyl-peptidase